MNEHNIKKLKIIAASMPFIRRLYGFIKYIWIEYLGSYDIFKHKHDPGIDEERSLHGAEKIIVEWPKNIAKPYVGLVKEKDSPTAYWPKYERFLINNDIPYGFFDIHRSDFIERAKSFDIILWRTLSNPAEQEEASSKVWILEKQLKKLCVPSYDELWFYESKVNQYYLCRANGLPIVNTFVSNSREETLEYIKSCRYPIVSKITTGSGGQGVRLINGRKTAEKLSIKAFGDGLRTYWGYIRQKNYVYYQDYLPNTGCDLRIIIVGNSYFGYRRLVSEDDFRAQNNDNMDYASPIPEAALILAKRIKDSFPPSRILAVDMLKCKHDGNYYFIEASIFYQIDYPSEMTVGGKRGRYVFTQGKFVFQPGKFWTQELALQEVMREWMESGKEGRNAVQDN